MPKFITTQTRTEVPGKPRVITTAGGRLVGYFPYNKTNQFIVARQKTACNRDGGF
jgi:hypothetical protein